MSTIAQEITRIQGGVNDVWDYCEDNGVTIPAGTTVDEARTYLDQIPHGGQENEFLTETDLSYMFDYRSSNDSKIRAGIQRFSQNQITNMQHCFQNYNDDTTANSVMNYILYIIDNNQKINYEYCFSNFTFGKTYNKTLDLSNIRFTNNVSYMFYYVGRSTNSNTAKLTIIIDEDTFKNALASSAFNSVYYNVDLKIKTGKIKLARDCNSFLGSSRINLIDNEDNILKEITIDTADANSNISLSSFFNNFDKLERIHFTNLKVNNLNNAFSGMYSLKSIDGIKLNGLGSTNANMFSTTGTSYYTDFGKLGIVSGSKFGYSTTNFNLSRIWNTTTDTVRDGQTIGYWYEDFANNLGTKTSTNTHTITINTTLYNSLTATQKALITDKGYTLAHAS